MEIITGYTGIEHVQSADDASLYRGIFGLDDYVLNVGSKLEANIVDNNTVRIMDGDVIIQGHQGRIRANDYNEVTIDNGTPGEQRNDLIVARYLKNTETGVESIKLEVVKGSPAVEATDPETIKEDLKIGGTQRDFALYRVSLDGINLKSVTSLFSTTPSLTAIEQNIEVVELVQTKTSDGTSPSLEFLFDVPEGFTTTGAVVNHRSSAVLINYFQGMFGEKFQVSLYQFNGANIAPDRTITVTVTFRKETS